MIEIPNQNFLEIRMFSWLIHSDQLLCGDRSCDELQIMF